MKKILVASLILILGGCATWASSNIKSSDGSEIGEAPVAVKKSPQKIFLSEKDITDRKYSVLGDIEVTVNKTTIFHSDPTREHVDIELRKEAAKLGADAVIFVRYGTVGVSFMSWGSLEGKGRAIAFMD